MLSLLFLACTKKDDIDKNGNGQVKINIKATLDDFANNLRQNKMASNYSYTPNYSTTTDLNKDFILVAELAPFVDKKPTISPKLLTSNAKIAATTDFKMGYVFRLMVFDSEGDHVATRDYTRGKEELSEPLHLFRNTTYTFVAYSFNSTNIDSLETILNTNPLEPTLSNTYIQATGNQDLLFYKNTKTTGDNAVDNLNIILQHQFNLIQTTINVENAGYSIEELEAQLSTSTNTYILDFETGDFHYQKSNNTFPFTEFTYESSPTPELVPNSIAISNAVIFNSMSTEKLLEITKLKIGTIINTSSIFPFEQGVNLSPGKKYNLSVKIIPKDSLYTIVSENQTYYVARINGQVWMGHNLGADYSINPNIENEANLGYYYQWGRNVSVANGTASGTGTLPNWRTSTIVDQTLLDSWERTTAGGRGPQDPCPIGFRLPTTLEFQNLIEATTLAGYIGTSGNNNYAMQLASKRKANVLITFPAQGYINISNSGNTTTWNPAGVVERGFRAYVKGITYGLSSSQSTTTLMYELLENSSATGGPSIYGLNGSGLNSTGNLAIAHPVRCIAISGNLGIQIKEREIDTSNGSINF